MKKIPALSILYWLKPNKHNVDEPFLYCRLTMDGVRTEISLQRNFSVNMGKWECNWKHLSCETVRELPCTFQIKRITAF